MNKKDEWITGMEIGLILAILFLTIWFMPHEGIKAAQKDNPEEAGRLIKEKTQSTLRFFINFLPVKKSNANLFQVRRV